MRELIFKNLTKLSSKKRDISIEEVVKKHGMISCTKKRSTYFVRGVRHMHSRKELAEWVSNRQNESQAGKKFFHILRRYSARQMEDALLCKMRGSFYIVSDQDVYNIVFVHAVSIKVKKGE